MSELSEKLEYYMNVKGLNLAELSKRSQIDRSTVFQYLKGKRPLHSREQFQQITAQMLLTPEEQEDLDQAYEITRIGRSRYLRRKKVGEIIASLFTIDQYPEQYQGQGMEMTSLKDCMVVRGELEVSRALSRLLTDVCLRGGKRLDVLVQPSCRMAMGLLFMLHDYVPSELSIRQIICLDTNQGGDGCYNLDAMRSILQCGIAFRNYQALYYYGNVSEHFGHMNILPYLFCTDRYAVFVASDGKSGMVYANSDVVSYLGDEFRKMAAKCRPLMESGDVVEQWQRHGIAMPMNYIGGNSYEVTSGVCTVQFWNKALIERYLNPGIPGYERLKEMLCDYVKALYEGKRKGHVTVIMNGESVRAFIQTGILREYPSEFMTGNVTVEDRRYLLKCMLEAMEEGWYRICMVSEECFRISERWEIVANQGRQVFLQYSIGQDFRVFDLREPDVSEAFYDYMEHLSQGDDVLDGESSAAQIWEWMEEYL